MEAAAHLQLEAVRRAAAQMVHRKHLLLTHTEQLTDPTAGEHMQRRINYHAVHDPDVHEPSSAPRTRPPSPSAGLQDTTAAPRGPFLTQEATRHRPARPSPTRANHTST